MFKNTLYKLTLVTALSAGFATVIPLTASAQDQVPTSATSTADPGRIQDQFGAQDLIPDVSPRIEIRDMIAQSAPPNAENIKFDLERVVIEGNTTYTHEEIKAVYSNYIHRQVSLADMYVLSNKITNKYRNDGYILSQVIVPPQTIENGTIKFRVVEGYIDRVTVVDDEATGYAAERIRDIADNIRNDNVLNAEALERYLLLINDLPGVEARSILGPSPDKTGAAELRVIVERKPYDAYLSVDNYGSRFLGPYQFTAAGSSNSLIGQNETISGLVVYAPSSDVPSPELLYGSVAYRQPITQEGTTAELSISIADTEPGSILEQFDVEGKSKLYALKLEHPFVRSRSTNLYGHVQFDWRDLTSENNLSADIEDNIRTLRVGGRVQHLDTLLGAGINSLAVEVAQGLDILGASNEDVATLSRAAGEVDFTKIEAEYQRLQKVRPGLNLLVGAKGQYTSDPLLSSEEFGVGGVTYGRGYDSSEIIGDQGFAGKVELQWNEPYEWNMIEDYQLYSFFDIGRTFNEDAVINSQVTDTLSSAGLGVRTDFTEDTKGSLTVAFPLNRDVQAENDRNPRVYFSLSHGF